MRWRSPLGPFDDEPSASWQRRRSCPLQTRTPDESLRILPPWLSIPTDFPLRAIARTRVSICCQGWAKTNRRSGPIQNTEITTEIGYKLAQRIAFFLAENPAVARDLFKKVK